MCHPCNFFPCSRHVDSRTYTHTHSLLGPTSGAEETHYGVKLCNLTGCKISYTHNTPVSFMCQWPLLLCGLILCLLFSRSVVNLCELLQREGGHQSAGLLRGSQASSARAHHNHRICQDRTRYLAQAHKCTRHLFALMPALFAQPPFYKRFPPSLQTHL